MIVLDEQGVERCFLFPTLGDCVEGLMHDDVPMAYKAFHAFNLWLDEDWGYDYQHRLYAPPYIPMLDPELAAKELDFVLAKGARLVSVRPGPAAGRSPADPVWDPFWARLDEAGAVAAYHAFGGPTLYEEAFKQMWGRAPVSDPMYQATLGRPSSVTAGSSTRSSPSCSATCLAVSPMCVSPASRWAATGPEEDVVGLTELIGVDRVVFGSDWPHPEGNIQPADYASCLKSSTRWT